MNNAIECLRTISSGFAQLADALQDQEEQINSRLDHVETKVLKNRQALKDAASMILGRLG